jgi:hypothetical protein
MQAFNFAGKDFIEGPERSAYGKVRTIRIPRLGLVVRITVLDTKVNTISTSDCQFELLKLQIVVDNA